MTQADYTIFAELEGITLTSITGMEQGSEEVTLTSTDGRTWLMEHEQSCCETVYLVDVNGDVTDLLHTPIVSAYATTNEENPIRATDAEDCFLWTFYRISTIKGTVVLRWYGTSNGYYGVGVDLKETTARGVQAMSKRRFKTPVVYKTAMERLAAREDNPSIESISRAFCDDNFANYPCLDHAINESMKLCRTNAEFDLLCKAIASASQTIQRMKDGSKQR